MRVSPAAILSVSLANPLPLVSTKTRFYGQFRFKKLQSEFLATRTSQSHRNLAEDGPSAANAENNFLVRSRISFQTEVSIICTLKGGVSHYLEEEGTAEWVENLFVFDSRLSLPPAAYNNNTVNEARSTPQMPMYTSFARCYICDSQVQELRHRNCVNLDCNQLFLCCAECVKDLTGCCCSNCVTAPRLRPVFHGSKRYEKWHIYLDS